MENGVRINVASAHTWLPPKYRLLYSGIWNDFPFCFISCFIFVLFFQGKPESVVGQRRF
jgi:hypothetical protein